MRGFTLVEILINVLILSFLFLVIYVVLNVGNMTYNTDLGILDLQQQGRRVMEGMIRELRQTNEKTQQGELSIPSNSVIRFYIPPATYGASWIGPITYYLDTTQNQIIREYPVGTIKIIANYVESLDFSFNNNVLDIQFNCAKSVNRRDVSLPFKSEVRLRNE